MKVFVVVGLLGLIAVVGAADDVTGSCYKDVGIACEANELKNKDLTLNNCNAKYGAIDDVVKHLQKYVNSHLVRSFEYLLMSTHFANYEANRPGFEKLYRGLSDNKWHEAIELIQYITKRGGKMNFNEKETDNRDNISTYELYEIQSLAKALDIEKNLATAAFNIHNEAARKKREFHDPEISSYLEKEYMHRQADNIRKLSGYTNDLKHLLDASSNDAPLALYLFDEYLQKQ